MKQDAVVRIELEGGRTAPPHFFARVRLSTDEPGHPYGQWSLAFEMWSLDPGAVPLAWAQFVAERAPVEALVDGARLELYSGTTRIGALVVTHAARRGQRAAPRIGIDVAPQDAAQPPRKAA